jgi:hypothetical protein
MDHDALLFGGEFRRPSAYLWYQIQRACVIAFFPCLAVSFVVIIVFRQGWISVVLALLAFASQTAHIAGLVQRGRELQSGYTTIPWLAGEVKLRDPVDGRLLVAGGLEQPKFTSIKRARDYGSDHPAATRHTVFSVVASDSEGLPDVKVIGGAWQGSGRLWAGASAAAIVIAVGFVLSSLALSTGYRAVGVAFGVVGSIALLVLVLKFLSGLNSRRIARQLSALSGTTGNALLVPVRCTVELFGEIAMPLSAPIPANLVLSVDHIGLTLWSGKSTLTQVCVVSGARVRDIRRGRARDTRGNEKPAIIVEDEDSLRLSLFPGRTGRGSIWYSDDATTDAIVLKIQDALKS